MDVLRISREDSKILLNMASDNKKPASAELGSHTTACSHPHRNNRKDFYKILYQYSSDIPTPADEEIRNDTSHNAITDSEKKLVAQWMSLVPVECCDTILRGRRAILDLVGHDSRQKMMMYEHALSLFIHDQNLEHDPRSLVEQLEARRIRIYDKCCKADDSRCICGQPSKVYYIYNMVNGNVLTVGSKCIDVPRVDYRRCIVCKKTKCSNKEIHRYDLHNMGRCVECVAKSRKVIATGKRSGWSLKEIMQSTYDPYADKTISLADLATIVYEKNKNCRCCGQSSLNNGFIDDLPRLHGWQQEMLCCYCIVRTAIPLRGKPYEGEAAVKIAMKYPSYTGEDTWDATLLTITKMILNKWYYPQSNKLVGYGKYKDLKCVVVAGYRDYIENIDRMSKEKNIDGRLRILLAYYDLHRDINRIAQ